MWSKAAFKLFVWFAAFWFLGACGIALVATNLFDSNGQYAPELVAACFLVGLIGGWYTLLRLKKRVLRGDDLTDVIEQIKEAERWRVSTAEDAPADPIMRRAFNEFFNKRRSPSK